MKTFIVVLFCLASIFLTAADAVKGNFETKGGSNCHYHDRSYDDGIKSIFFDCSCVGATGKPLEYSCEYYGNPSKECELFDKPGGTERFYHYIAEKIRGDKEHTDIAKSFYSLSSLWVYR